MKCRAWSIPADPAFAWLCGEVRLGMRFGTERGKANRKVHAYMKVKWRAPC